MILLLGDHAKKLEGYLTGLGERVQHSTEPLPRHLPKDLWLISFGYRHIIPKDILGILDRPPINIHISLLPWNRGADPNLWSWLENTPKGVTIHEIDEGIDTGPILCRTRLEGFDFRHNEGIFYDAHLAQETLRSTYDALIRAAFALFYTEFAAIQSGKRKAIPQLPGAGSFHKLKDKHAFAPIMTRGWDTPVLDLIGKGVHHKSSGGAYVDETHRPLSRLVGREPCQSNTTGCPSPSGSATG